MGGKIDKKFSSYSQYSKFSIDEVVRGN